MRGILQELSNFRYIMTIFYLSKKYYDHFLWGIVIKLLNESDDKYTISLFGHSLVILLENALLLFINNNEKNSIFG
jgi:hypothetical protein